MGSIRVYTASEYNGNQLWETKVENEMEPGIM